MSAYELRKYKRENLDCVIKQTQTFMVRGHQQCNSRMCNLVVEWIFRFTSQLVLLIYSYRHDISICLKISFLFWILIYTHCHRHVNWTWVCIYIKQAYFSDKANFMLHLSKSYVFAIFINNEKQTNLHNY